MNQTFRNSDPDTSRQPVKNKLTLQLICLAAISQHSPDGICAGELGQLIPHIDGLWKRLSELSDQHLIVRGPAKIYPGTGKWQTTWIAAPDIKEQQLELGNLGGSNEVIYWH